MKHYIVPILWALCLTSCSWEPEDPRKAAERLAGEAETTDVMEIEPGVIIYNGVRLEIGSDKALWKKTLGNNFRTDEVGKMPHFYFWDDLGIRAQFDRPGHPGAKVIDIYLIRRNILQHSPARMDGYAPRSTYRGKLYIEGVRVGGGVSARDLRAALYRDWIIGCIKAIGICQLFEKSNDGSSGIGLILGDRLESGPLESVQVGPPRAKGDPL